MTTKNVNFRVDEQLKKEADDVLSEIGLSITAALTMFLKQIVNKRAIPFLPEAPDNYYSRENQIILEKRLKEKEAGKILELEIESNNERHIVNNKSARKALMENQANLLYDYYQKSHEPRSDWQQGDFNDY